MALVPFDLNGVFSPMHLATHVLGPKELCMAVQAQPVWVHVASKVWLILCEQMVFKDGAQVFHCAALQAKALLVKSQAQAQANLYTQEQQVRTSRTSSC